MSQLVSIIVPTYNRSERLREALESIRAQTYPKFEVMVVNDGGTNAASDVVLAMRDPRFHYNVLPHRERSAARNFGLRQAQGKYIAFCDDDDLWLPEKLSRQIACMENTGAAISYTNAWIKFPNGKRQLAFRQPRRNVIAVALTRNLAPLITFMVERRCFTTIGGFDEHLSAGEDYDLWLRALPHYQFHVLNQPLAVYVVHDANTVRDKQRMSIAMNAVAKKNLDRLIANYPQLVPPRLERRVRRHLLFRETKYHFRDRNFGRGLTTFIRALVTRTQPPP